MRLWHYKLIPVLPNKMLVAQWRECVAIKRQWEKGTLKHRLVSYVMNYDKGYFRNYIIQLHYEMNRRHIKYKENLIPRDFWLPSNAKYGVMYPEHNDRYLKQCYYNLQEKYDRGIITKEEWRRIYIYNEVVQFD